VRSIDDHLLVASVDPVGFESFAPNIPPKNVSGSTRWAASCGQA
jgi:hypothetical protein